MSISPDPANYRAFFFNPELAQVDREIRNLRLRQGRPPLKEFEGEKANLSADNIQRELEGSH